MPQIPNPETLTLAREIRGITQTDLARVSGIDQGRISRYEGGVKTIPEDELKILAKALAFPTTFFYRDGKRYGAETGEIFHRKRDNVSIIQQKVIDGLLNARRLEIEDLLNSFDIEAPYTIPRYDIRDFSNYEEPIDQIATLVRAAWNMSSGPVNNLIEQLEAASCMVFSYDFGTDKIDEAIQWIEPSPPVVLVNSRAPGDRLRFSLAHALGHLVMHRNNPPYPAMEPEADLFASAFLMPAEDIRPELRPVTIDHMLQLKPYWKVSMQALIHRCRDIGEISDRKYTSLFQMLSRAGYRKNEPITISSEKPTLVRNLLNNYKNELDYSNEELAALVRLNVEDFRNWYYPEPSHIKILKKPKSLTG